MLVLTRKAGQEILIGKDVKVTFLGWNEKYPNEFKIGIEAPKSIPIVRTELLKNCHKYSCQKNNYDENFGNC